MVSPLKVRVNGAAIRAIRSAQGRTAAVCAGFAGVDESTWLRWERGVSKVAPKRFQSLVEALGLDDRNAILAFPEGCE